MSETKTGGRVTLPAQKNADDMVKAFMRRLRVDAIRDSDGTQLSEELKNTELTKYSTICLVRSDQEFAAGNTAACHQKFLTTDYFTAREESLEIDLLRGYHPRKYTLNPESCDRWWQVIDRTAGQVLARSDWEFLPGRQAVRIPAPEPYHAYSVNFLVYQTWDSTSMYNHLTNGWEGDPVISVDPYNTDTEAHLFGYFDRWLATHDYTDVVRLTTLAYSFVLDSDEEGRDRYRDWTGYLETVSPEALEDFRRETGVELTAEDFIAAGLFNGTDTPPSEKYRLWMAFIQKYVFRFGSELVRKIHGCGKKAAIFWGDHWVGVEPYGSRYGDMGLDIHIGACEDGVALRRLADCPVSGTKEIRLYPYFFPDVFREGGNPLAESRSNWVKIRRALLVSPVDRIGWGGYLHLANRFPEFMTHLEEIADEFRDVREKTGGAGAALRPVKVGVLSRWGALRSWINAFGKDQKFLEKRPDVTAIAGTNLLECLAGLPFDVEFISFDEVIDSGVPGDLSALILYGEAGSAWSGGDVWDNPVLSAVLRKFVDNGGAMIGCQDPSARFRSGRFFQLSDVFGVDRETGLTPMKNKRAVPHDTEHFITADLAGDGRTAGGESYIFADSAGTRSILTDPTGQHIHGAVHPYGKGRAVYFHELPWSPENSRLLYRALLWAAGREDLTDRWFTDNPYTECHPFPEAGLCAVSNLSDQPRRTRFCLAEGDDLETVLEPRELRWFRTDGTGPDRV